MIPCLVHCLQCYLGRGRKEGREGGRKEGREKGEKERGKEGGRAERREGGSKEGKEKGGREGKGRERSTSTSVTPGGESTSGLLRLGGE